MADDETAGFHPNPEIAQLEVRRARAIEQLHDLNRVLQDGEEPYAFPAVLVPLARVDALASILVENGLLNEDQFYGEMTARECEHMEQYLASARERKRDTTGLILPPTHLNGSG